VICDFCGYLAQVKTKALTKIPATLAGAAWIPQKERMDAGIYFPLFLVLPPESADDLLFIRRCSITCDVSAAQTAARVCAATRLARCHL
jgi:type II restriction enzyme